MPSMDSTEKVQQLMDTLEAALVKMFRLCQSLFTLTKEERQILIEGKANDLEEISSQKAKIIEEIENSEISRSQVSDKIAQACGLTRRFETLSELLDTVIYDKKDQIRRLQEGILALQTDIREINNGNYALATLNLQHLEAVQGYLVNLIYAPSAFYAPPNAINRDEPPKTWGMDHKA